MRLTLYTDYSLRVLLYLGAHPDRPCSVASIARAYGISHNHLGKVVHELGRAGYVSSVRGRHGGLRLARVPTAIGVGEVVRRTEDSFELADCASCRITPACALRVALQRALEAFFCVLDGYTLADLLTRPEALVQLLAIPAPPPGAPADRAANRRQIVPIAGSSG